jgi:acetylcholinesterase
MALNLNLEMRTEDSPGPLFIPDNITTNEALRDWLKSSWLIGVPANSTEQNRIVDKLFELYPDNPALGSPFGTGNETFGRPAVWKRASALYGDFEFQVQQREWRTAAALKGIKVYAYHFTDPQPQNTLGGSLA